MIVALSAYGRSALRRPVVTHGRRTNWLAGVLAAAMLVALHVIVVQNDAMVDEQVAAASARAKRDETARDLAQANAAPQVRIDAQTFECRNLNIRAEWEAAVAAACQRFASILQSARASK